MALPDNPETEEQEREEEEEEWSSADIWNHQERKMNSQTQHYDDSLR